MELGGWLGGWTDGMGVGGFIIGLTGRGLDACVCVCVSCLHFFLLLPGPVGFGVGWVAWW